MCYIDNVVDANIKAAISKPKANFGGECYNIACGDRVSNNQILEYFQKRFKYAVVKSAPWRQGDVMHTQANINKAKRDLGYDPKVMFWEGLEKTIDWWDL